MAALPSLLLAVLFHSGCQTAPADPHVLVLLGGGVGQLAKGLEVVDGFWCLTDAVGVGFLAGVLGGMCRSVDHRGVARCRGFSFVRVVVRFMGRVQPGHE
jgi:hypothetical protein